MDKHETLIKKIEEAIKHKQKTLNELDSAGKRRGGFSSTMIDLKCQFKREIKELRELLS